MGHLCPNLIPGLGFTWGGHSAALDLQLLVGCSFGVLGAPPHCPGVSLQADGGAWGAPVPPTRGHWVGAIAGGLGRAAPAGAEGCSTGGDLPGAVQHRGRGEPSRLLGGPGLGGRG